MVTILSSLFLVRAALRIQALAGYSQPLDGASAGKVLGDNLRRVLRLYVAVPDRLRVDNHRGAVLALIQAAGFIDAHFAAQPGGLAPLLQLGVQIAASVGGAGRAGRVGRAGVVADKDVALKCGQAAFLLIDGAGLH